MKKKVEGESKTLIQVLASRVRPGIEKKKRKKEARHIENKYD